MPLRDHFRPPLSDLASWEGLHGGWPMVIVQQLGKVLPAQYIAEPRVHLGTQIEIDVATFDRDVDPSAAKPAGVSGPAADWAPVAPSLTIETELADFDEYEVRIYDVQRGRRLVAAIEIISPANKDRPESRQQFIAKCAALLRQGVSLALVDLVTVRDFNLYAELLQMIGERDPVLGNDPAATYAVACRSRVDRNTRRLDAWTYPLSVGQRLPCLPLWLTDTVAIPMELETSYEQTCRDLRIA